MDVTMIIDLQYGSTGKGLMAGYLSNVEEFPAVASANMPNAGHTFINADGVKFVNKVLPSGVHSPSCRLAFIGPGAVFDPYQLESEYCAAHDAGYKFNVLIHESAWILRRYHANDEAAIGLEASVGSTTAGAGAASIEKMERDSHLDNRAITAYKPSLDGIVVVPHSFYIRSVLGETKILAEGSQGYSLGLNAGFWPHCTSRDCTPNAFMSAMALPHLSLTKVVGTMRCHPIRVGGNSGGWYDDQQELRWSDIGVEPETTTVTGRERRVATFSKQQIIDAHLACRPNELFLNFCNYDRAQAERIMGWHLNNRRALRSKLVYTGWGPTILHVRVEP